MALVASPNGEVERGTGVTFGVINANGAALSNWRFDPTNQALPPVTSSQTDIEWSGEIVSTGDVSVTATVYFTSITLKRRVSVRARPNWESQPVAAQQRQVGYSNGDTILTANDPRSVTSGVGASTLKAGWTLDEAHVKKVSGCPNTGYNFVSTQPPDLTAFDWVWHPQVEPGSDFYIHQWGNWSGTTGCSVTPKVGTGFISGVHFAEGVARHEAGPQNSHWRVYADALSVSNGIPRN